MARVFPPHIVRRNPPQTATVRPEVTRSSTGVAQVTMVRRRRRRQEGDGSRRSRRGAPPSSSKASVGSLPWLGELVPSPSLLFALCSTTILPWMNVLIGLINLASSSYKRRASTNEVTKLNHVLIPRRSKVLSYGCSSRSSFAFPMRLRHLVNVLAPEHGGDMVVGTTSSASSSSTSIRICLSALQKGYDISFLITNYQCEDIHKQRLPYPALLFLFSYLI